MFLFSALALLHGCTDGPGDTGEDTSAIEYTGCRARPQRADRNRTVVVSIPYDDQGGQSEDWRSLTLSAEGSLDTDGQLFKMGRATGGEVAFTPDGEIGLVAQSDGSVGVFAVEEDGAIQVIHEHFDGPFFAERVLTDSSGETLWILDSNWVVNGGGLYRADIDCDTGELTGVELAVESMLAKDLLLDPAGTGSAILVGREVPGTNVGDDLALVDLNSPTEALAGADAFGDDEAIMSDATWIPDGRYALVGDHSAFSGIPNRVAVVEVGEGTLTAVDLVEDLNDPVALVASPWSDQVLVLSGYDNAIYRLASTGDDTHPFQWTGELTYQGADPQLPTAASLLTRGPLAGHLLVTENQGVRQVQMSEGAEAEDLGLTSLGSSYEAIAGAVGVQP